MLQTTINNAVNELINTIPTDKPFGVGGDTYGQCTALPVRLYQILGWPTPAMAGDSANGWGVSFPSELEPYVDHEAYQAGKAYPEGTVMMWNSPHMAVVVNSDGSNVVKVFEQNADKDGSYPHLYNRTVNEPGYHEATFVLIPKVEAPVPPVQVSEVVPAPVPPVVTANITYSKLASPLELLTNKQPTYVWGLNFANDTEATSVGSFPENHPFTAYGKAQFTTHDKPCYYMDEASFGSADQTGIAASNIGINTVDLNLPPASPPAEAVPAPVVAAPANQTSAPTPQLVHSAPAATVTTPSWQKLNPKFDKPVTYIATTTLTIHDLSGVHADVTLAKGKTKDIVGQFPGPDGKFYYLTEGSYTAKNWLGIPVSAMKRVDVNLSDSSLEDLLDDIELDTTKVAASTDGVFNRLFHKKGSN